MFWLLMVFDGVRWRRFREGSLAKGSVGDRLLGSDRQTSLALIPGEC
jgi:hypothetical protein